MVCRAEVLLGCTSVLSLHVGLPEGPRQAPETVHDDDAGGHQSKDVKGGATPHRRFTR